jgi:hypothetical protein
MGSMTLIRVVAGALAIAMLCVVSLASVDPEVLSVCLAFTAVMVGLLLVDVVQQILTRMR